MCFEVVLGHALSVRIAQVEVELRDGKSLLRGLAVPRRGRVEDAAEYPQHAPNTRDAARLSHILCFAVIPGHALRVGMVQTEVVLRLRITTF